MHDTCTSFSSSPFCLRRSCRGCRPRACGTCCLRASCGSCSTTPRCAWFCLPHYLLKCRGFPSAPPNNWLPASLRLYRVSPPQKTRQKKHVPTKYQHFLAVVPFYTRYCFLTQLKVGFVGVLFTSDFVVIVSLASLSLSQFFRWAIYDPRASCADGWFCDWLVVGACLSAFFFAAASDGCSVIGWWLGCVSAFFFAAAWCGLAGGGKLPVFSGAHDAQAAAEDRQGRPRGK